MNNVTENYPCLSNCCVERQTWHGKPTDEKGKDSVTDRAAQKRNGSQKEAAAMNNMIQQTAGKGTGVGPACGPCPAYPVSLSGNGVPVPPKSGASPGERIA
jgi:hypothetical protein